MRLITTGNSVNSTTQIMAGVGGGILEGRTVELVKNHWPVVLSFLCGIPFLMYASVTISFGSGKGGPHV